MSQLFASGYQNTGVSASATVLSMIIQGWFPLELTGLTSLLSKGLRSLLHHHNLKTSILLCSAFFKFQLSQLYMTTGKTIALTTQTFVSKIMPLIFNTLSRFVIAFLLKSNHLLISWLQSKSTDFRAYKEKICHYFHFFHFHLPWSNGAGCCDLSFLRFSFKPAFSLLSITLIKRLFCSSFISTISMVLSTYLRLLMFLLPILLPAYNSSSLAFLRMCSAYRLNKQNDS